MEQKSTFTRENFVDEFLKREREEFLNESLRNDKSDKLISSPKIVMTHDAGNRSKLFFKKILHLF